MRYDLMAVLGVLIAMWASCLGCGLMLERVLGLRLSNALVLPLGLCVSIVIIFPGYVAGAGDGLAIALLLTIAICGLLFARDGLRARLNPGWPGLAGLGTYVLYMLPVIAYGGWTWAGYDFVNDSAFEMLLANHAKGFGTVLGNVPESSQREFLVSYLGSGYPLGTQTLLGTFSGLTATPVPVIYQGFISFLAASGAVALATTMRALRTSRAALIAFVALAANLTYQYALQGGIKEIGLLATLCATVALAREAIALGRPYLGAVLIAIGAAASLATYNAVAVPFLGALVLSVGVSVLLLTRSAAARRDPVRSDRQPDSAGAVGVSTQPPRAIGASLPTRRYLTRWIGPLILGGALTALLAIPSLTSFQTFYTVARAGQGATGVGATQFGQLLRRLPLSQISGVWLAGEYRVPVQAQPAATLTVIATVAILLLLIPGVLFAVRRREPSPLLLIGMVGLVFLIVFPRVSPYAQGKLLAISSPAVVLVALIPLAALAGRASVLALALTWGLAAAIIVSDLLAYGHAPVAPTKRMDAIEQTGRHFKGEGTVLWNEFEEYAKYFAAAARISVPFEALTPQQVQLRSPTYFYGHYFDLDQELLSFVERYPIIVTRRSPSSSRPPANYRLVYQNRYYLGWRRSPRPLVLRHLPEQSLYSSSSTVSCRSLRSLVAGAPGGTQLAVALAPEVSWFEPLYAPDRSFGWGIVPSQRGAIIANTPGHASGVVQVMGDARYSVWVQGDFPRPVKVQVDGATIGSASGANTPDQWFQVTSLDLGRGQHELRIVKPSGRRHFGPGEWGAGIIGAVALQHEGGEQLRILPVSGWRMLCGATADWVELIRP
jgi:hypothetical protein